MTTVIRRPVGALAVLTVAGLLAAGCSSGPGQAGTALIVGGNSVSVDQVQHELNNVVTTQPTAQQDLKQGKLDQTARGIVTMHVLHQLITPVAADQGLTVTDQQVDQLITQSGGIDKVAGLLSTDPANAREAVRDVLLEVALARKNADSLVVTIDYVIAANHDEAKKIANQLAADPNAAGQLVNAANAQAQASGSQGAGGQLNQPIALADVLAQPGGNVGPLFGAPANTVVAFQPAAQQNPQWIVALIRKRTNEGGDAGRSASQADIATLQGIGVALLQSESSRLGVRVSPRYGVWDQVGMQVAPSADQAAGLEIPVHTARQ